MRKLFVAVGIAVAASWVADARAQCRDNSDCRGGRVCVNGSCTAPPPAPLTCARDIDCPESAVCEGGICVRVGGPPSTAPSTPSPPVYTPPAPQPPAVYDPPPAQPAPVGAPPPAWPPAGSAPCGRACPIGTYCDGFQCVSLSAAPPAEGYVPESLPWILQVNFGYGAVFSGLGGGLEVGYAGQYIGGTGFFNLGWGVGMDVFGYGGGARFLAGVNPHFGYVGFAYAYVATATATDGAGGQLRKDLWGPSLLFGYEWMSAWFRVFVDIGFSYVPEVWDGALGDFEGAVFTFDVGIGADVLGW